MAMQARDIDIGRMTKWQPKTWKPVYDEIVLLSVLNVPNKEIAKRKGLHEIHVSNILTSDVAKQRKAEIAERMQEKTLRSIEAKMETAAENAADRVVTLMKEDRFFDAAPFKTVDRALKVLQGVGKLKKDVESGINVKNAVILVSSEAKDLIDGLKEAAEVRALHSGVEEAEFEVVND